MLLPIVVGAAGAGLLGYGLNKAGYVSFGAEDITHDKIYNFVLEHEKDPKKIALMGTAFKAAGKEKQGNILLRRSQKAARRAVTSKAFRSHNPAAVRKVAQAFENDGCVGHARSLNEYAGALEQITNTVKNAMKE